MIQNYSIKYENNEEVLYLYLDYNYEFARFNHNCKPFFSQLKEFLNNRIVNFKGKKIVLMVSGIIIGTIFLNNIGFKDYNTQYQHSSDDISYVSRVILNDFNNDNEVINTFEIDVDNKTNTNESIEKNAIKQTNDISNQSTSTQLDIESKPKSVNNQTQQTNSNNNLKSTNNQTDNSTNDQAKTNESEDTKQMVTVYRTNGNVVEIELEEYLIGVVAGEMPASFNSEALKAQAIIARTYTLKSIKQGKKLTDSVSTQVYIDSSQMKAKWGSDYSKYYNKIKSAVESTKGMYITYNGDYIDAVYFSTSNGYTEDAKYVWGNDIPYLKPVESKWDIGTTNYTKKVTKTFDEISNKLGVKVDNNVTINNIERNESNRIKSITINGQTYTGVQIRTLLNLNSADFDIEVTDTGFTFTNRGYGHGVGMSQYGANGMANDGLKYDQIIKYYYQGVTINH